MEQTTIEDTVTRWTTAPEAFDGFGTVSTGEVRLSTRGKTYRQVRVARRHLEWQTSRNSSGMYPLFSEAEFEDLFTSL